MIIQSSYLQRVGAPKRAIINFLYKGFDILLFKQERKNNKSASHDLSLRKKKVLFSMITFMKISRARNRLGIIYFFQPFTKVAFNFFQFWGVLSNESTRSSKGNIIIILNINNKNRIPDSINFLTRTKQNDIIIALKETKKIPTLIRRTSGQRSNCVRANWSFWWALPCKKGDSTRAISRE